jgi:hypothetical protein
VLFIFTGRKARENNNAEAPPEPQEENNNVYINKLMEQSIAIEEEIHSPTEVEVKDTNEVVWQTSD